MFFFPGKLNNHISLSTKILLFNLSYKKQISLSICTTKREKGIEEKKNWDVIKHVFQDLFARPIQNLHESQEDLLLLDIMINRVIKFDSDMVVINVVMREIDNRNKMMAYKLLYELYIQFYTTLVFTFLLLIVSLIRVVLAVGLSMLVIGTSSNNKSNGSCGFTHHHFLSTGGILCFVHALFSVVYYVSATAS